MMKTLNKLGIENFLNLIIAICEKTQVTLHLNIKEKMLRNRQEGLLSLPLSHCNGSSSQSTWDEKEIKFIQTEQNKTKHLYLLTDDMIILIEYFNKYTKNIKTNKFSKVAGYKINVVDRIMSPCHPCAPTKDVHILIFRTCECLVHGIRGLMFG